MYLDDSNYVILGVIFGTIVILLMLGIDYLAVSLLLIMWPFWLLYMKFFTSLSVTGLVINEIKKLVTLLIVSAIPNLILVFVIIMFSGLVAIIVTRSYLVLSVSSSYIFLFIVLLYLFIVSGYRSLILGLIPLPLFFAKVSLPWYVVYVVIVVRFGNFL